MSGRAWSLVAAGLACATGGPGCARAGFPEGGPVDDKPPEVVRTVPEDRQINVPVDVAIDILYDEPLAEGVQAQARQLIFMNPDRPEVVTNAGGKKIEIQPRVTLDPNTTYSVTIPPGLPDRRGNATKEPLKISFSTGGPLTLTLLKGTVTRGEQPLPGARVRAFHRERKFGYQTTTNEQGNFEIRWVALGPYEVSAWIEGNNEPGFQYTLEAGDTATAVFERVGTGVDVELALVLSDTSAARPVRAEPLAEDGLGVLFTDTLAAEQPFDSIDARLLRLAPELVPRGTPLDSIPQAAVRGEEITVSQVLADPQDRRALLLRLEGALADSTAYAVRVSDVRNAAGLTTAADSPFLLFRTREVPDSTLTPATAPAPSGAPGAPDAAPTDPAAAARRRSVVSDTLAGPSVVGDTLPRR